MIAFGVLFEKILLISICVVVNYLWFREVYRFYFITNPTN